ncbi:PREDICTED: SLAM family member 9-like isoform X3 [Calidris pugnax]|uniref:SLAM family member 9-like isoform X3 n=1 Tax=Calidris pugnax TaxID=198806 RepID=UPI00071C2331|nr:PREDICTED: SLAM family member 9-like isoform X3 [Calidris pugnax]
MDVSRCLPLTLLLLHQAACVSNRIEVVGVVGKSVTFFLQNLSTHAVWSFHNEVIATVKSGHPPEVTFFDNSYNSRLAFNEDGRTLTLSQLRMNDTGDYIAKTPERKKTTFTLRVYRELAVPSVTCVAQNCSANGCNYTLLCAVSGHDYGNVIYGWKVGDELWSEGPMVLVEGSLLEEPTLTCVVQNPVSNHNVTVTSPDTLCAAPENTTHPPTIGTYSSKMVVIVVTSVIGVIVFLILTVIFVLIYCKSKGWNISWLPTAEAVNTEARAEYTTVYAQVGPYQQVPQQSLSKEHQNNTKKTPFTDEEGSHSIYFTIQAEAQMDHKKGRPGCQEQDEKTLYSSVGHPEDLEQPRQGSGVAMNLL